MKKILLLLTAITVLTTSACEKNKSDLDIPEDSPRTSVPAEVEGNWMYGNFSMTEYWSQDPYSYLGNALQFAIAFKFEANGTYTQYFTSSSVLGGVTTYQQSVTKGTVKVDPVTKTIKTHPHTAHYKRTRNNQVVEERDLSKSELTSASTYTYTTGTETSGTKALYLTLAGTSSPLTFLKK
jgi:hypothetical protein